MTKNVFVIAIATAIVVSDQLTKWYIRETLPFQQHVTVIDGFFHIIHVRNTGGAFSLFAGAHDAIRSVLLAARLSPSVRWLYGARCTLTMLDEPASGSAVLSEPTTERYRIGRFLLVHRREYYWPAFNVADSFISIATRCSVIVVVPAEHRSLRSPLALTRAGGNRRRDIRR
jgi:signal peptidase II